MFINLDRSFYRFVTIHACDRGTDGRTVRQTDRRTEFSSLDRVCITCSAVKNADIKVSAVSVDTCSEGEGERRWHSVEMI